MDSRSHPRSDEATVEQFVVLFTQHQRRIFQYILSLQPSLQDAEDILQETNLVLWRKFKTFDPQTSFVAWAIRVAYFEVLKHRKVTRNRKLTFLDDELIDQLGAEAVANASYLDAARDALHFCLNRLRPEDRALVSDRYGQSESGKGLAERMGRPQNSVYKSLGRIRRALLDCIGRTLARTELSGWSE